MFFLLLLIINLTTFIITEAQNQTYTMFWWDKRTYSRFEFNPPNSTMLTKGEAYKYEAYNAPLYDMDGKKIGIVLFVDTNTYRFGSTYVTEDATFFSMGLDSDQALDTFIHFYRYLETLLIPRVLNSISQ